MRAIVRSEYGSADVLRQEEMDAPSPGSDEVLIEVRATSVNASDWEFLTGSPVYTRMWGLFRPKYRVLGSDIAGVVVATGEKVTKFQPGDAVFGDALGSWGGFAELACAPEAALLPKPESMTFEEAAALPQSAGVAAQGLRDAGAVQPGQRVLINGAGGGSGTFAIQIAKALGAEVTGVDSAAKHETMRSAGADDVIDYRAEDFTKNGERYDLILDFIASHSIFDYRRALSPEGKYVMVGGSVPHLLQALILGSLLSIFGSKKMGVLGAKPNEGLDFVMELMESGKVTPVIDACFPLSETPAALRRVGEGHALGKVVVTM